MTSKVTGSRSFGAFNGVFIPTFLSIIGVILYLRLGYIVGSAGLFGALMIILLSVSITFATALALVSITTTMRIGSGGAYSIISKTLGLEVGGSVGIPLYLAQTFAVALYVFGFSEMWTYIFPSHIKWLVSVAVFLVLFLLTFINVKFAVKVQVLVFLIVLASLASFFAGVGAHNTPSTAIALSPSNTNFWSLFALFFPAVTGLMAGVGMSGELTNPRKQIPKGVLWGLGITTVIYVTVAILLGQSAGSEELINNPLIIVDLSTFKPIVFVGVLAATFSSALTTLVAAPRLLQALGENSILPASFFFSKKTSVGEPRNAVMFTSIIIMFVLLLSSLNSIAQLLTVFFLITYAMINLAVFIEQSLGLLSFRPTFKIPKVVTLYGALGSMLFMFLISAVAGLIATIFLFITYLFLVKRRLQPKEGDVRSGLFRTLSEWAAKKVLTLPESTKHTWKPNILLPVVSTRTLLGNFPLIKSLAYPSGTMTVLGMDLMRKADAPEEANITKKQIKQELSELPKLVEKFGEEGIFTSSAIVSVKDYTNGICVSLEAMESQVFHPNILALPFKPEQLSHASLSRIFETVKEEKVGVVIIDRDEDIGLGSEEDIHVWIHPRVLEKDFYEDRDFDLGILIAYRLHRNWAGYITLWMCCKDKEQEKLAKRYLEKLIYESRFPASTKIKVSTKTFTEALDEAPQGDIHIIPVSGEDIDSILRISKTTGKSFLFVADSTQEDVLS